MMWKESGANDAMRCESCDNSNAMWSAATQFRLSTYMHMELDVRTILTPCKTMQSDGKC